MREAMEINNLNVFQLEQNEQKIFCASETSLNIPNMSEHKINL